MEKPTPLITSSPPNLKDHALIGEAEKLPASGATPVLSISPLVLSVPGRPVDLQIKVTIPTVGENLPIILLSHGQGSSNHLSSLNGYGPMANFWAGHGFVVIQPTHLSSKSLSLDPSIPGAPLFWRSRAEDMSHIIDQLEHIENIAPVLRGRMDHSRIAVIGHSMGGHTAGLLLGARLKDPDNGEVVNLLEPRIKAGVLIGAPGNGNGGKDLSEYARENLKFFRDSSFKEMTTPALVVAGDKDISPFLTIRGADWFADYYTLSTGPKSLLTLHGAEHLYGGVSGYDANETTDESVERVAIIQRLTAAYLRSTLYPEDPAWSTVSSVFETLSAHGKIESK